MFHCTTSLLFPPVFPVKSPGPADEKNLNLRNAPFFLFSADCHEMISVLATDKSAGIKYKRKNVTETVTFSLKWNYLQNCR